MNHECFIQYSTLHITTYSHEITLVTWQSLHNIPMNSSVTINKKMTNGFSITYTKRRIRTNYYERNILKPS